METPASSFLFFLTAPFVPVYPCVRGIVGGPLFLNLLDAENQFRTFGQASFDPSPREPMCRYLGGLDLFGGLNPWLVEEGRQLHQTTNPKHHRGKLRCNPGLRLKRFWHEVIFQPSYYAFGHFSRRVRTPNPVAPNPGRISPCWARYVGRACLGIWPALGCGSGDPGLLGWIFRL